MIEVEKLRHRYGDVTALENVSLTIDSDEFVVLAGPNGSGKTTLVRHFNGLLEPDRGTVEVDGLAVGDNPVAARTSVGMVFQHPRDQFVATTIGADVAFGPENLGLGREEIERRVDESLAAVGLAGRRSESIDALSGGEQARVAIAGALAMEPSYLVLDEPLAGLDLAGRKAVLRRLDDLRASGTTIVIVTHDLGDLLERADRIVVLFEGAIELDEPPATARERLEAYDVQVPR